MQNAKHLLKKSKGIKNNNNLSDVEKALLLHDRLAVLCEYDYNSTADQHNMYGVFVNQTAVCQGYAMGLCLFVKSG